MATEDRYASSHITGNASDPANAVGAADGTWTTDSGAADWTSRWAMGDPSGSIGGTQTVAVLARKTASGGGAVTIAVNLYENGSLVQSLAAATEITSTTGETVGGTFDGSAVTNPNNVEIEVVCEGSGGGPNTRTGQIDEIKWTVNLSAGTREGDLNATLGAATLSATATLAIAGTLAVTLAAATLSGVGVVDVQGSATPTLAPATLSSTGTVDITGDLTSTLSAATLSASGTVGSVPITGDLSVTLGTATLSGVGVVDVVGTLTKTLDVATLSASGTVGSVAITGDLNLTLDSLTTSATGAVLVQGEGAATLGAVSLSASGSGGGGGSPHPNKVQLGVGIRLALGLGLW